jgi:hypothetical protein
MFIVLFGVQHRKKWDIKATRNMPSRKGHIPEIRVGLLQLGVRLYTVTSAARPNVCVVSSHCIINVSVWIADTRHHWKWNKFESASQSYVCLLLKGPKTDNVFRRQSNVTSAGKWSLYCGARKLVVLYRPSECLCWQFKGMSPLTSHVSPQRHPHLACP